MFAKWLCKWLGHSWVFLPEDKDEVIRFAVCRRCLEKERLFYPEPSVVPQKTQIHPYGASPVRYREFK
jgi:hypothetical protein